MPYSNVESKSLKYFPCHGTASGYSYQTVPCRTIYLEIRDAIWEIGTRNPQQMYTSAAKDT
jgi:hypothetical protein